MRIAIVLAALALVAGPALGYHQSVGGDVAANFPPAQEQDGPDVPRDDTRTIADRIELVAGAVEYTNSEQFPTFDRTSPPDQWYNGAGLGYFDVVIVHYYGGAQLSLNWDGAHPAINQALGNPSGHSTTFSPNFYTSPPDHEDLNVAPGTPFDPIHSGTLYPALNFFYAYAFGDGSAQGDIDGDGQYDDELLAGQGPFEGLIDATACTPRTERCQLLRGEDLDQLIGTGTGQQAAICGWHAKTHSHPTAEVTQCRDFDFGYLTDNPEELSGQTQPTSPTWLWSGVPGWYGNIAFIPPGGPISRAVLNYHSMEPQVFHFTIGAAFDPDVQANGGINADGDGRFDCLEPGFDLTSPVGHDLDIFWPPNSNANAVGVAVDDIAFGAVREAIFDTIAQAQDIPGDVGSQLQDELEGDVLEARDDQPAEPGDNSGALTALSTESKKECVDATGDHDAAGLIEQVDSQELWSNLLNAEVYQYDAGLVDDWVPGFDGLRPLADPLNTYQSENPGGGVLFGFESGQPAALAQVSDKDGLVAMHDNLYETGPGCVPVSTYVDDCLGDVMRTEWGYRAPTGLVFVLNVDGPVAFVDRAQAASPEDFVWADYTGDTQSHCVVGASKNVMDGSTVFHPEVFQPLLERAGFTGDAQALSQSALKSAIDTYLCGGADTLDYFPGDGFLAHQTGNSLSNRLAWIVPTHWSDIGSSGQLDVYYVVTAQDGVEVKSDQLGLAGATATTETVVSVDGDLTTFVWQDQTLFGDDAQ